MDPVCLFVCLFVSFCCFFWNEGGVGTHGVATTATTTTTTTSFSLLTKLFDTSRLSIGIYLFYLPRSNQAFLDQSFWLALLVVARENIHFCSLPPPPLPLLFLSPPLHPLDTKNFYIQEPNQSQPQNKQTNKQTKQGNLHDGHAIVSPAFGR